MNKDYLASVQNSMAEDIKNGKVDEFSARLTKLVEDAQNEVMDKFNELKDAPEETLIANGVRTVFSKEEKEFYNSFIESVKNTSGITDVGKALPVTTVDKIFEDLKEEHPLLSRVDFINSKGLTEWLITTESTKLYAWGDVFGPITAENHGAIAKVQFQNFKLTAWMLIPLDAIDLGMKWVDLYVRTILKNAIGNGLTEGILNGTGQKMPVGMTKVVNIQEQTVPAVDKEATAMTSFDTATLGAIAAVLSDGGKRTVTKMMCVCNPVDYLTKILPAITVLNASGAYAKATPFEIDFVQEPNMTTGKAVFGLAKNYFATVGVGPEGKITHSDQFRFLDDVRVFKSKVIAFGTPKDNVSFVVKDISGLEPAYITVKQIAAD